MKMNRRHVSATMIAFALTILPIVGTHAHAEAAKIIVIRVVACNPTGPTVESRYTHDKVQTEFFDDKINKLWHNISYGKISATPGPPNPGSAVPMAIAATVLSTSQSFIRTDKQLDYKPFVLGKDGPNCSQKLDPLTNKLVNPRPYYLGDVTGAKIKRAVTDAVQVALAAAAQNPPNTRPALSKADLLDKLTNA